MVERLWAGWRSTYLASLTAARLQQDPVETVPGPPRVPGAGPSLFEAILASGQPDEETLIVWRGVRCFALLNLYPYVSGHLLVLPRQAVADLELLDTATAAELWQGVTQAVVAVKAAYRPDGVNVGANLGTAAGAGVPDHLHLHVLPRWFGDTNFTTTMAETRVMPEPLSVTWERISQAWPR